MKQSTPPSTTTIEKSGTSRWIHSLLESKTDKEIFPVEHEGKKYWIKRGRPTGSTRIHALGYRLTSLPFLRPVEVKSASEAAAFEAEKLLRLREKGLPVPQVVHREEGLFVMTDTGGNLSALLKGSDASTVEPRLGLVVDALAALHRSGEYHGASQIRNFTLSGDERVSIIDFEESFEADAELEALQFRDLFLLLYSLHRQKTDADFPLLLERYMERSGNRGFDEELRELYRRFRWLAKIVEVEGIRRRLGSDAEILHRLFESLKG
ncbi:hypothetical protein [Nitratifractor sp.]